MVSGVIWRQELGVADGDEARREVGIRRHQRDLRRHLVFMSVRSIG
jgi:hypothetical protein